MSVDRVKYVVVKEEFIRELRERRKQRWGTPNEKYRYRPRPHPT